MEIKSRIIEMPEPLGLYAGQLFARGEEYLEAFRRLSEHDGQMMHAKYFMMAHAFEVLLKSFLAASGVSKRELQHRQLGHNLENIYAKCVALGIPPIANIEVFAREIAEKNRDFDFRYPSNYNLRLPSPRLCMEVLNPLVEALRPLITRARTQAQIKWAKIQGILRDTVSAGQIRVHHCKPETNSQWRALAFLRWGTRRYHSNKNRLAFEWKNGLIPHSVMGGANAGKTLSGGCRERSSKETVGCSPHSSTR